MKTWLPALGALLLALPHPAAAQALDFANPYAMDNLWNRPDHGWSDLVAHSKIDARSRQQAMTFVARKLRDTWSVSLASDGGYRPFRELIAELYQAGEAMGADKAVSHKLLHDAAQTLDRYHRDQVPNYLYEFLKPG